MVTESGFGADCGAEKFMDIKCRVEGLKPPDAVVIVCSVRALKMHGGAFKAAPGKKINEDALKKEDVEAVKRGGANLEKHIENMKLFGVPVVVAINRFLYDTDSEIAAIKEIALKADASDAVVSEVWEKGGEGGIELAKAVIKICGEKSQFRFLYPLDMPIENKIETIAKKIYGAKEVSYSAEAKKKS